MPGEERGAEDRRDDLGLPAPPWMEQRRRPSRRTPGVPLDRDRIVAAGLRIVDAEGVDALSVRRLASELGVAPMSVYWHVRDKAHLFDLIGEAVLESMAMPPAEGDWRDQVRAIHRAMLAAVLAHPNTADLMIGRARYGPAGITMFEQLLSALLEAGLTPEAAFDAYQSLYVFVLGFIATANRTPAFRETQRQGVLYLRSLDAGRFPSIARVAPVIGSRTPIEQFEVGLDVVIEGIAARLVS